MKVLSRRGAALAVLDTVHDETTGADLISRVVLETPAGRTVKSWLHAVDRIVPITANGGRGWCVTGPAARRHTGPGRPPPRLMTATGVPITALPTDFGGGLHLVRGVAYALFYDRGRWVLCIPGL